MSDSIERLLETRRFTVVEETVVRPDGRLATCQYVVHPGAVAIVPLVGQDHLCLIRNRRLTVQKTLWEIPAGTREPNEEPLETARRELEEETGYRAGRWEPLVEFFPSPGTSSERIHVFVASELTAGEPRREENEEIENAIVSWDEAQGMLDRGEIEDGKTIIALLAYARRSARPEGMPF